MCRDSRPWHDLARLRLNSRQHERKDDMKQSNINKDLAAWNEAYCDLNMERLIKQTAPENFEVVQLPRGYGVRRKKEKV